MDDVVGVDGVTGLIEVLHVVLGSWFKTLRHAVDCVFDHLVCIDFMIFSLHVLRRKDGGFKRVFWDSLDSTRVHDDVYGWSCNLVPRRSQGPGEVETRSGERPRPCGWLTGSGSYDGPTVRLV